MSEDFRQVIRNSRKKSLTAKRNLQKQQFTLPYLTSAHQSHENSEDVSDRLRRLQGNLRILERQYKLNLKQGFDNKIKAYRLEAVVERKLFKHALSSVKQQKEREELSQKKRSTSINTLDNSRVEIMKIDRQNRQILRKQRVKEQKRQISLSLHEREEEDLRRARKSHDKILEQAENINIKRDYLNQLKQQENRRKEEQLKNGLLHNIVSNTQKLKSLKIVLQNMKGSELVVEKTFLTI